MEEEEIVNIEHIPRVTDIYLRRFVAPPSIHAVLECKKERECYVGIIHTTEIVVEREEEFIVDSVDLNLKKYSVHIPYDSRYICVEPKEPETITVITHADGKKLLTDTEVYP